MTMRSDIFLLLVARAGDMGRTPITIVSDPHNETAVKATSTVTDLKFRYYFIVWLQIIFTFSIYVQNPQLKLFLVPSFSSR